MKISALKSIAAVSLLAIAACQPQMPADATPVDLPQQQAAFFAQNPNAEGAALSIDFTGRFEVFTNGAAVLQSSASSSGLRTPTQVQSIAANQICFARSGSWGGACIDVFQSASAGGLYCVGRFSNGVGFQAPCRITPL